MTCEVDRSEAGLGTGGRHGVQRVAGHAGHIAVEDWPGVGDAGRVDPSPVIAPAAMKPGEVLDTDPTLASSLADCSLVRSAVALDSRPRSRLPKQRQQRDRKDHRDIAGFVSSQSA